MLRLTTLTLMLAVALIGCDRRSDEAKRGAELITQHGFGSCHIIPGHPTTGLDEEKIAKDIRATVGAR